MKSLRRTLWIIVMSCVAITWLPYFGILNAPALLGPFPYPLAITLVCNVVLTLCVMAIYPLYFCPFFQTLKDHPIEGEHRHD